MRAWLCVCNLVWTGFRLSKLTIKIKLLLYITITAAIKKFFQLSMNKTVINTILMKFFT